MNTEKEKHTFKKNRDFAMTLEDILDDEKEYIKERRKQVFDNSDCKNQKNDIHTNDYFGIAFSGGGIRSATFCLGVMQAMMKAGIFKFFDYLSTVSGGGYIGTCLTSLLQMNDTGVDAKDSPFVELNDSTQIQDPNKTSMSVRNQIHHLRSHGNYLAQDGGLFSRDMLRFYGTFIFGSVYHILIFSLLLIAAIGLVLSLFLPFTREQNTDIRFKKDNLEKIGYCTNNDKDILVHSIRYDRTSFVKDTIRRTTTPDTAKIVLTDKGVNTQTSELKYNTDDSFFKSIGEITQITKIWWNTLVNNISSIINYENLKHRFFVYFFIGGIAFAVAGLIVVKILRKKALGIITDQHQFVNCGQAPTLYARIIERLCTTKSGLTSQDDLEYNFANIFVAISFLLPVLATFLIGTFFEVQRSFIFLPASFAIGALIVVFVYTIYTESKTLDSRRIKRSFNSILKGASLSGTLASIIIPLIFIFSLSLHYFTLSYILSIIAAIVGGLLYRKNTSSKKSVFFQKYYKLFANIAVIVLLIFSIAPITTLMLKFDFVTQPIYYTLAALALLVFTTYFIDSNRISAHAFYRDRLTEAYLMTHARVKRGNECDPNIQQGNPLMTIRNHENMTLSDINIKTPKAPYHLMVTALNLHGTDETLRKTLKSEHFIFSPLWVGSDFSGYVSTRKYNQGKMYLASIMTISGAAFNSLAGFRTFFAQSFFATLLNMRLGYWLPNPWRYKKDSEGPSDKFTLWIWYLLKELFGKTSARSRLVYLSDGGHTGDNLGLLPLLQRKCKVIFVVDAEQDNLYTFDSFNTATHLAFVEENIRISIDLTNIVMPDQSNPTLELQKDSVALGTIYYPDGSEGTLVYLKSSCSKNIPTFDKKFFCYKEKITNQSNCCQSNDIQTKESTNTDSEDTSHTCDNEVFKKLCASIYSIPSFAQEDELPSFIENYNRKYKDFPHQTTTDQFFDPEQFGAYRGLGERVAWQAIMALKNGYSTYNSEQNML